jgi:hypothetical protein
MTDTRKEFEEWFERQYGKKPIPSPKNGDKPHTNTYMTMFADGADKGWQACQSLNDKRIQQLLAVIELQREALDWIADNDDSSNYVCEKRAREALAIKQEDVELVEVKVEDHLCAVITEAGGYTKYNGPTVYTIKTKE